jgi:uroporphyrinogen decarboxylase
MIKERFLGRPIRTLQDEVEFWHRAGYDYVKLQPAVEFRINGQLIATDHSVDRVWAPEGQGVIRTWEDFEQYAFPRKEDIDYRSFEKISALLPEGMGVIGQYGDIFTLAWELMGLEGFSLALYDSPALVEALINRIGEIIYSMFEYFAQCEQVHILWYSDDIAYANGLLMSPQVLRQYVFPWLQKIGTLAREYDKPFIYHSDGMLWDVMEDIIACGVDALHPIEPKAMDIVEVKRRYGDRLCLIGNLDVGELLARGTPEEVRAAVRKNIELVGYNGGYCVGSGNSIPEYVQFENYLAMLKAAREYV